MVKLRTAIITLLALLALCGCREKLSDAQAVEIMKEVAAELSKMQDASMDSKLDKVRLACDKKAVKLETFAQYVKDHPEAEKQLADLTVERLKEQSGGKSTRLDGELARLKEETDRKLEGINQALEQKKAELERARAQELEKLKQEFEKKQEELLAEIARVENQ